MRLGLGGVDVGIGIEFERIVPACLKRSCHWVWKGSCWVGGEVVSTRTKNENGNRNGRNG